MRPDDFAPFPARAERRFFMALTGRMRRFRVVGGGPDFERWARAWARRWVVVVAATADLARDQIARYDEKCAQVGLATPVDSREYGILEAGHNAAGHAWQEAERRLWKRDPGGPARDPARPMHATRGHPAMGGLAR